MVPDLGQRKGPATPLPERGMEECRGRDRAGAEECPGAPPAYRLMGWWAGNPPTGDDRGEREDCKGRDGHPVAGAALAYRPFISLPKPVYSLIYTLIYSLTSSLIYSAICSATHPAIYTATKIAFDLFHYIL